MQDSYGYMWFGTQDGLVKYNGFDFEVFRPDKEDSFSIADNFVRELVEDPQKNIWVSTRNGISKYDRKRKRFYNLYEDFENQKAQLYALEIRNDTLWYNASSRDGLFGLSLNCKLSKSFTHLDELNVLRKGYYNRLSAAVNFFWHDSTLIWLTDNADYPPMKNSNFRLFSVSSSNEESLKKSQYHLVDDSLIVSYYGQLCYTNWKLPDLKVLYDTLFISSFLAWNEGYLLGTSHGLLWTKNLSSPPTRVALNGDLHTNTLIEDLFIDNAGNLWIGTANEGLFMHHRMYDQLIYLNPKKYDARLSQLVWQSQLRDSIQLIGTNSGLLVYNHKNNSYNSHFIGERITAVYIDQEGKLYAGTNNGDAYMAEKYGLGFKHLITFPEKQSISDFQEDHEGLLWIATFKGLFQSTSRYFPFDFKQQKIELSPYFLNLYNAADHQLYIGHNNGFSVRTESGSFKHYPYQEASATSPNFYFVSGFTKKNNELYCATYGGGISHLQSDGSFANITEKEGLANNLVFSLTLDESNRIWACTNGGISIINPITEEVTNLGFYQGVKSSDFALGSIDVTDQGVFLVGGSNGLLMLDPKQIQTTLTSPNLLFERVEINYEKIIELDDLSEVSLSPEDRIVNFTFTALNYTDPSDLRYRYQLNGFDSHWVNLRPSLRTISFSSLPPGKFELIVEVFSKSNLFESTSSSLKITVLPPWWQQPQYYLPFSILFFLSLISIVYYLSRRNLKVKLKELEMKQKVQDERERISRDLHDSVGTHFAYIVSQLDFLSLGWHTNHIKDKKDYLEKLSDFARSGMKMLRETIWALNQEEVECQSLKIKIEDYLKLCFSNTSVQFNFTCEYDQDRINSNIALNVFRIIQESVSNALKHAQCDQLQIYLHLGNHLKLIIKDNGDGFNAEKSIQIDGHYGLKNIKKRADEIQASVTINSNSEGTEIILQS